MEKLSNKKEERKEETKGQPIFKGDREIKLEKFIVSTKVSQMIQNPPQPRNQEPKKSESNK